MGHIDIAKGNILTLWSGVRGVERDERLAAGYYDEQNGDDNGK
jgi:hypothetical protein